jgi:ankyrin repeat protein
MSLGIAALAACVPPSVVQYTSFHDREFSERSKPAEIQQKSTADLLGGEYLLIGYIDLRRNVRTCYEDGKCVDHSDPLPSRDNLRQEAASRGGDVVTLLDERTILEPNDKSYCTSTSVSVTFVNNAPVTTTTCNSYKTVPGKLEARVSRALIWRHDPAAARGDANARAIEAALKTLEATNRAEETKVVPQSGSFLGNLLASFAKKDNVAAREADAFSQQVYQAIARDDIRELYALARDGKLQVWSDPKGRTALMVALSAERLQAARTLLAIDKGLERRDANGLSAIHYAVARADLPMVRELVKAGYDVRIRAASGSSLLFHALFNDRADIFEWLLTQGLDARDRTAQDETTLMVAAGAGRDAFLRRLLDLGVEVNRHDKEGRTALMYAARSGRPEVVEVLLNVRARHDVTDQSGNTVLHYGAGGGSREVLRMLLQQGLGTNIENKMGATALVVAIGAEQWDAAGYLMDRGASLVTGKFTAEDTAAFLISKNQPQLLQRYLVAFPPLRELLRRDPDWLLYAAKNSGAATIRFMADLGARVNRPGTDGLTPLITAAVAGNHETVRALLELKADPTARGRDGQTALKMATLKGHPKVVETLREFGVRD